MSDKVKLRELCQCLLSEDDVGDETKENQSFPIEDKQNGWGTVGVVSMGKGREQCWTKDR